VQREQKCVINFPMPVFGPIFDKIDPDEKYRPKSLDDICRVTRGVLHNIYNAVFSRQENQYQGAQD
jgi:hypothetical protein